MLPTTRMLNVDGVKLPMRFKKMTWVPVVGDGTSWKMMIFLNNSMAYLFFFFPSRPKRSHSLTLVLFIHSTVRSRLECSVCGHSWFQSRDRLMSLNDGYELVPLPQMDLDRIATNLKEGKSPKYTGDSKLYVGNISFDSSEEDLIELFSEVGELGSIALVRDDQGRNRGFGFVTMRTEADGKAAMEKLNGIELNGRNLAVRESNN